LVVSATAAVLAIGGGLAYAVDAPTTRTRTPIADSSAFPPDKEAIVEAQASQLATASAAPKIDPHRSDGSGLVVPVPVPSTTDSPTTGVVDDDPQGPFGSAIFAIDNFWQGRVNGIWTTAYVGFTGDGTPGVRVYTSSGNPNGPADLRYVGFFPLPSTATNVTPSTFAARSASAGQVHIQTGATSITFDLANDQYAL
jgi:hypothetical protein